jgi:hypothetical protein
MEIFRNRCSVLFVRTSIVGPPQSANDFTGGVGARGNHDPFPLPPQEMKSSAKASEAKTNDLLILAFVFQVTIPPVFDVISL